MTNLAEDFVPFKAEPKAIGFCLVCDDEIFGDKLRLAVAKCRHCVGKPLPHPTAPLKLEARRS